jgi:diaminohydroxyphosphoribosylaminopyrimidine deaminase/5-amino-6-(5-phosphoribosylamino)uracil reductase
VGAVIVKDGALIATGATEPYGQRHAERCAIDNVADPSLMRGATIYTTLEPCAHWGKQPPCADLVASRGFARCVSAVRDPNPLVSGVGLGRVRASGTDVTTGVLHNELVAWHLPYLFPHLLPALGSRPFVSVLAVDSPAGDGRDLLLDRVGRWDDRDPSRRYRSWLRHKCDLVVTELSRASVEPAAFARGPWRGLVWCDMGGSLAGMSVAQVRDFARQARDLGAPVALVCRPHPDNAAQLDACVSAGVGHITPPDDLDLASWLTAYAPTREFAAMIGGTPTWLLVDNHPRLAEALARAHATDTVHTVDAPGVADDDATTRIPVAAEPTGMLSRVARTTVDDVTISEFYPQRLSSALVERAW